MDEHTARIFQVVAWIVASVGGCIAAFLALAEARKKTLQRQEELRWNRAKLAMEVLDSFKDDEESGDAVLMLDWDGREFEIDDDEFVEIDHKMLWNALRTQDLDFVDAEIFIRDCFDSFFDHFEKIETFIQRDLIDFADLKKQMQYHVENLLKNKPVVAEFLKEYRFHLAKQFLDRFDIWRNAAG